jgi:hypothetical protein
MKFIEINGMILDYDKYRKEVLLLKRFLELWINELLERNGFENGYHKELDLEFKIGIKKRSKNKFV